MAPTTRLFVGDEEMGKRDDDHKPRTMPQLGTAWYHGRWLPRRNIKRIGMTVLVLTALYFFFKNMPTDLKQPLARPSYDHYQTEGRLSKSPPTPSGQTQGGSLVKTGDQQHVGEKHWFDGPIKFYELAASLYAISRTRGGLEINRNVLFAASSLKSASILLPAACEMARQKRNDVHFVFMGREEIPMDTLKELNGVTKGCVVWLHDARPDFGPESSDFRMEVSCGAALKHINTHMHPQAVIIDNSGMEENYFLAAMKTRSADLGKTLIELPANSEQNLRWITRLDSASLNAFNKISIDILVHAQPSSSGSLIRLLTSLSQADYFSSTPPRLTIELPYKIDQATTSFLAESFSWPPSEFPLEGNAQQLTLHRRIPQHGMTSEESSIRFLESFWPANRFTSHVLLLSPQTEVSPLYYHYLKYAVLEYKYSAAAAKSLSSHEDLIGISLDLPSTYLNDTTSFTPPPHPKSVKNPETNGPSFLWGSPNSNAALYFGDKWTELHTLTSHALRSPNTPKKRISTTYPSWLEHLLTLSMTRGYSMLYPQLTAGDALATVHNELFHPPEEFSKREAAAPDEPAQDGDFTADPATHLSLQHAELPLARASLLNLLPADVPLPPLSSLSLLAWDGRTVDRQQLVGEADAFSARFRREVGGCKKRLPPAKELLDVGVEHLFCDDGEEEDNEVAGVDGKAGIGGKAVIDGKAGIDGKTRIDGKKDRDDMKEYDDVDEDDAIEEEEEAPIVNVKASGKAAALSRQTEESEEVGA